MPLRGFFNTTELPVLRGESAIPECGACGFYKDAKTPKIRVSGVGRKGVLFVGRFPQEEEDRTGSNLRGNDATTVRQVVGRSGIDLDKDCWWANAIICHPKGKKKKQIEEAVDYCRPNLPKLIRELNPRVIIPLGSEAVMSLMSWLWRPGEGGIHRYQGFRIPNRRLNAWVVPTWHPAMLVQEKDPVLDRQFRTDIKEALELKGRPYPKDNVPPTSEEDRVDIVLSTTEAAERIAGAHRHSLKHNRPVAFDYETTCKKPDGPHSRIVTCAISDGFDAIAFPFDRRTRLALRELLGDRRVRKIGANDKFEARWSDTHVGPVRGWWWDVNLTAHAMYNASKIRSITPVDFQATVHLGVDPWDTTVSPYLTSDRKSGGGYTPNRIHELDLRKLLLYNGLDALYEFQIAMHQRRTLGLEEY